MDSSEKEDFALLLLAAEEEEEEERGNKQTHIGSTALCNVACFGRIKNTTFQNLMNYFSHPLSLKRWKLSNMQALLIINSKLDPF